MRTTRSLFFQKCQDAYELVQLFLSDDLSLGHLDGLLPKYEVSAERGQIVKEKVRKSLQVLSDSLESHRYVISPRILKLAVPCFYIDHSVTRSYANYQP